MKLKYLIIFLLIALATYACSNPQSKDYTLNGTFSEKQVEGWIEIQKVFIEEVERYSAYNNNGKFTFEGEASDFPEIYAVIYPTRIEALFPIFVEPGTTNIRIDLDDKGMKSTATKGKVNKEYQRYRNEREKKYLTKIEELNNQLSATDLDESAKATINQQIEALWDEARQYDLAYIKRHPASPVSLCVLCQIYPMLSPEELGGLLQKFPDKAKQTAAYKMLEDEYTNQIELKNTTTAVAIGSKEEPLPIDLSDKSVIEALAHQNPGKVIYVDVWGTWCGNCIKEFPSSHELQEKLKNEDIVFAYVCVWSLKNKWEEMIHQEQLVGQHLILNKEQQDAFIGEHFGKSIALPKYLIIDKDGTLVSKDAPKPSDENIETILRKLIEG